MRRDATTRQGEGEAERLANLFVARCLIEDAVFPLTRRFRPRTFVPRNGLEQKLGYRDKTRPRCRRVRNERITVVVAANRSTIKLLRNERSSTVQKIYRGMWCTRGPIAFYRGCVGACNYRKIMEQNAHCHRIPRRNDESFDSRDSFVNQRVGKAESRRQNESSWRGLAIQATRFIEFYPLLEDSVAWIANRGSLAMKPRERTRNRSDRSSKKFPRHRLHHLFRLIQQPACQNAFFRRIRRRSIAGGRTKISRRRATKQTRRCRRSARSPRCRIPWSLRVVESRGPAASSTCSPPCWTRWG